MKKLNISEVEFSWKDKIKKITIPEELTPDLAEDIGIHIGDGNLHINRGKEYYITYAGHTIDDMRYFRERIVPLKEKLFNEGVC